MKGVFIMGLACTFCKSPFIIFFIKQQWRCVYFCIKGLLFISNYRLQHSQGPLINSLLYKYSGPLWVCDSFRTNNERGVVRKSGLRNRFWGPFIITQKGRCAFPFLFIRPIFYQWPITSLKAHFCVISSQDLTSSYSNFLNYYYYFNYYY